MTDLKTTDGTPIQVLPSEDDDTACNIWFGSGGLDDPGTQKFTIRAPVGAELVRELSYNCGIPVQELMNYSIGDEITYWESTVQREVTWTRGGDAVWRPDHPAVPTMTDREVAQQEIARMRDQARAWLWTPNELRLLSASVARYRRLLELDAPQIILENELERVRSRSADARAYLDRLDEDFGAAK